MKKIILLILTLFCVGTGFSQEIPSCDKENAYVFDSEKISGKAKDEFKFVNYTSCSDFGVTVYGYKKNNWTVVGNGYLKELGDTETLKTNYDADDFRYYAVCPNKDFGFNYCVAKANDNLNIFFLEKNVSELNDLSLDSACIIDADKIKGKFKDNFCFEDAGGVSSPVVFYVFASNNGSDYELLLASVLLRPSDHDKVGTSLSGKKISSFRYYKIAAGDGKTYSYDVKKEHSDLVVYVK